MNYKELADLIFPDAKEISYYEENIQEEIYQRELLLPDLHLAQLDLYI